MKTQLTKQCPSCRQAATGDGFLDFCDDHEQLLKADEFERERRYERAFGPHGTKAFTEITTELTWMSFQVSSTERWALDVVGGNENWAGAWPLPVGTDALEKWRIGWPDVAVPDLTAWQFQPDAWMGLAVPREVDRSIVWLFGLAGWRPHPVTVDHLPGVTLNAERMVWTDAQAPLYKATVPVATDFRRWHATKLEGLPAGRPPKYAPEEIPDLVDAAWQYVLENPDDYEDDISEVARHLGVVPKTIKNWEDALYCKPSNVIRAQVKKRLTPVGGPTGSYFR